MKSSIFVVGLLAFLIIASSAFAQMGKNMEPGMAESGQPEASAPPGPGLAGAKIFENSCANCHPDGGNVIVPSLPLKGSRVLANFRSFLAFIRNPKMPDGSQGVMPAFSPSQISKIQARQLYHYITFGESDQPQGGYGMGRGMGGYGMGRGMMGGQSMGGGYGMGRGMRGGYGMGPGFYMYSPECQKFYDETAVQRKELHDKWFEYFEAIRNPKTTGEAAEKLEEEIRELQKKIYSAAPLGCRW